jgi:hypothetical protein
MCAINSPFKAGHVPSNKGTGMRVDKKCPTCKKTFNLSYKLRNRKYCTPACYRASVPGRKRTVEACKRISEARINSWKNPETIMKHKMAQARLNKDMVYREMMERKTAHKGIWGHFYSEKNRCKLFYASRDGELSAYLRLEKDPAVASYGRCNFIIPYIFDGVGRTYRPDIMVKTTTGEIIIIEVKPEWALNHPSTQSKIFAKLSALREYCENNGMTCAVWTEKEYGSC